MSTARGQKGETLGGGGNDDDEDRVGGVDQEMQRLQWLFCHLNLSQSAEGAGGPLINKATLSVCLAPSIPHPPSSDFHPHSE